MTDQPDPQLAPDAEIAVHLIRAGREILAASKAAIEALDAVLAVMEDKVGKPAEAPATLEAIPIRRPDSAGASS
jgi:hypothetical protein